MERMSLDVNKMTKDQLKQHILMLAMQLTQLEEENKNLNERIRFLEQCLDNKEKVNKSLREDLKIWKLTAKDYAKQCGVDLDDNLKI